jgi:hypothetical protein
MLAQLMIKLKRAELTTSRASSRAMSILSSPTPKAVEGFLLGYDSNTRAYRVFNKSTGLVEVSCDIVFDETNDSQVEQVDLDELDDEEALCVALRNMSIGDVCPKEYDRASTCTRSTIFLHASISTNPR